MAFLTVLLSPSHNLKTNDKTTNIGKKKNCRNRQSNHTKPVFWKLINKRGTKMSNQIGLREDRIEPGHNKKDRDHVNGYISCIMMGKIGIEIAVEFVICHSVECFSAIFLCNILKVLLPTSLFGKQGIEALNFLFYLEQATQIKGKK